MGHVMGHAVENVGDGNGGSWVGAKAEAIETWLQLRSRPKMETKV